MRKPLPKEYYLERPAAYDRNTVQSFVDNELECFSVEQFYKLTNTPLVGIAYSKDEAKLMVDIFRFTCDITDEPFSTVDKEHIGLLFINYLDEAGFFG